MTDSTIQLIVGAAIGLLILSGFIYLFDDIFGKGRKKASKELDTAKQLEKEHEMV